MQNLGRVVSRTRRPTRRRAQSGSRFSTPHAAQLMQCPAGAHDPCCPSLFSPDRHRQTLEIGTGPFKFASTPGEFTCCIRRDLLGQVLPYLDEMSSVRGPARRHAGIREIQFAFSACRSRI